MGGDIWVDGMLLAYRFLDLQLPETVVNSEAYDFFLTQKRPIGL